MVVEYQRTRSSVLRAELVRANLPLVRKLAYRFKAPPSLVQDLVQEGCIGLLLSFERWSPDKGVKVSTYAVWWIRARQLRHVLEQHRLIRFGTTSEQRKLFFRYGSARGKLLAAGLDATPTAIAQVVGVSTRDVEESAPRLGTYAESEFDPILHAATGEAVDDAFERAEQLGLMRAQVERFVDELKPRDRQIFVGRFLSAKQQTCAHLGRRLGISRERVRQLEQRMVERLRSRVDRASRAAVGSDTRP